MIDDPREPDRTPDEEAFGSRAALRPRPIPESAEGRTYVGRRAAGGGVACDVALVDPETGASGGYPLQHFVRHSPTGFECGYHGSGPADLARCILIDVVVGRGQWPDLEGSNEFRVQLVERLYQRFKEDVVARLDRRHFELRAAEVWEWMRNVDHAAGIR